ncbi:MAG: TlpA family protein disulfide reductase [Anaerolineae bacterium]|nr:TlpA family protein disulfide reductase [Anaerolineae bacterium]
MTDTTLGSQTTPVVPRLSRYLWAPAIVVALIGVLATGFYLGKHLLADEPDVVELPARSVNSIARLPDSSPIVAINDSASTTSRASEPGPKLTFGQPAPDFTLKTADGQTVRLSDFKGRPVLVNFWATWCAPCLVEMPALEQVYAKYKDQGLVVLAVNEAESADKVGQYMQTYGLSFTAVLDMDLSIGRLYRITGYPTTWLVDREGNLRQLRRGAFGNADQIERLLTEVVAK